MKNQSGAALLVALLILVIVSVLGVVSMRGSIFSAKMATGTQAQAMAFEANETAISQALQEYQKMPLEDFDDAMDVAGGTWRCVMAGNPSRDGRCGASDYMDSRKALVATSRSMYERNASGRVMATPISGGQLNPGPGGSVPADLQIRINSRAEIGALSIGSEHQQNAVRRGYVFTDDM